MNQEVFNWGRNHHPTSGLFAVGVALLLGAVGFLLGHLIDRSVTGTK